MKTNTLILIVGVIITSSIIFVAIWNNIPKECDDKCEHERRSIESGTRPESFFEQPKVDSDWITGEDYCQEWCDNDELYQIGCDQSILAHITKYSNLLDEEFDGTYSLDWIGLPNGMSKEKFNECVDFIYEKRIGMELTSGKIVTGSYELEDPLCMGGRGMIKNENCEIIGKYNVSTGMPIVENKEQCDMLEGDWDEEQKICDSKYGMGG